MPQELQKLFVLLFTSLMLASTLLSAAGMGVGAWVLLREILTR